jgi:hypothetical protein
MHMCMCMHMFAAWMHGYSQDACGYGPIGACKRLGRVGLFLLDAAAHIAQGQLRVAPARFGDHAKEVDVSGRPPCRARAGGAAGRGRRAPAG